MNWLTLKDGNKIPAMGFGCYNAFGEEMTRALLRAVEVGYRYIDSAARYGNETAVGEAVASMDIPREEIFLLSKAWPSSYENVEAALMQTMKDLKTEYLDAYLLHWPGTDEYRRLKAYEQLLELHEKGLFKTVGVSNFMPDQLEVLKAQFGEFPSINELETHPCYQQREKVDWCQEQGIQTIAYSPINRNADLQNDTVKEIGARYDKTAGQAVLRWHVQRNQLPIPKSSNPGRILENIGIFDFELTAEEMEAIDALECGAKSGMDPLTFNG